MLLSGAAFGGCILGGAAAFVPASAGDADAAAYRAALLANGGTISDNDYAAVGALFAGMKADGTWAGTRLIAPLAGDNLAAALVGYNPQASAAIVMVNHGFAATAYAASTGLQGTGNAYVDTLIDIPSLSQNNISLGTWALADTNLGNINGVIAPSYGSGGGKGLFLLGAGAYGPYAGFGEGSGVLLPTATGWVCSTFDGSGLDVYAGATRAGGSSSYTGDWRATGTYQLLQWPGFSGNARLGAAIIGNALTADQNSALYSRLHTFLVATGRISNFGEGN